MLANKGQSHAISQLFTVRLWLEECGNDQSEIRAQVQHILSGETRYFRDWAKMAAYMKAKLQETNPQN